MKRIERSEVLGLGEYEAIRDRFRARVIQEKKARRVKIGDRATAVFENRDTALLQIQEMLRTERITREAAIMHEIETYNELVPGDRELSATLMIEIDDKAERDGFLERARGLEDAVALIVDGERQPGHIDERMRMPDRTSAVTYLKFPLSEKAAAHLAAKKKDASVAIVLDHAAYRARATLPPETCASLAEDLA